MEGVRGGNAGKNIKVQCSVVTSFEKDINEKHDK
jgi:hypothetical protein